MIEQGSIWHSIDGTRFQVIAEVVVDGKEWIYYRKLDLGEVKEFSCYKESFLSRFYLQPQ